MGQPCRLPETNVLFFPQAWREEDFRSQHQKKAQRDKAMGSQRPHSVVSDYAIVSLTSGDRASVSRPRKAFTSSRHRVSDS